jgi:hydroxymethylglutaryl-CoA lyase
VEWVEVGPRDGLQSWPDPVTTPFKVGLIESLLSCGFERVEATSMVHPKRVPRLADAEAVLEALHDQLPRLRVLVPNARGMERALAAGTRNVAVNVAATEGYNGQNLNASIKETLDEIEKVLGLARKDNVRVDASLSVAFGCPFEGAVSISRVLEMTGRLAELGIQEIALGDTVGAAHPAQVEETFQAVREALKSVRWGAHFHDTRGMAMANLLAALETGITLFEGSIGGIGGSPFAPGAAGNICSEDALFMLDAMGIDTGVDLGKLIELARRTEKKLGAPLPGKIHNLPQPQTATAQP